MTKILILGGGGMVGQKLANHLLASGLLGHKALDITLFDMAFPLKQDGRLRCITGSLTDAQNITMLARLRPDIVFHLASIVSGEAESNFDAGWQVNMFTMWHYLEALKALHIGSNGAYVPKIIFTSSIAVFGGPFPEQIDDTFLSVPQTSYGAQKASCELLLSDFSRKGFVDGISLRLPTICVRPGKANLAASSFFSGIIREPLNGQKAILPVDESVRHWHASPRAAPPTASRSDPEDPCSARRQAQQRVICRPRAPSTTGLSTRRDRHAPETPSEKGCPAVRCCVHRPRETAGAPR